MKRISFFLTLFLILTSIGSAQENFVQELLVYQDISQDIKQIHKENFKPLSSVTTFSDTNFWLKIVLDDKAINKPIYIEVKETFLKEVHLYSEDTKELYRIINNKDSKLKIDLKPTSTILYAKVFFDKQPYLDISAYTIADFNAKKESELLKKGGYYILVFLFTLINIFLYISFREKLFLWYILFFLSVNLGIALYDNTIAGLVQNTKYIDYLLAFEYWICPISAAIFSIKFLRIKKFYPKLVKAAYIMLTSITILIIGFLITNSFKLVAFSEIFSLTIYLGSWLMGFVLIKRVPSAKYYVIGYCVLYFTAFLYALSVNFGLHLFPLTINHLKLGVLIEIVVLTYAIIKQIKHIDEENKQIKIKLLDYIKQVETYKSKLEESQLNIEDKLQLLIQKFNLTKREAEILYCLAKGYKNQQIADELFVSVNTVKYHIRNIYEKSNIKKRAEITTKLIFD